jgi:hypothetical protein
MDRRTAEASCVETQTGWLDSVTGDILMQVITELASMMSLLGRTSAGKRIMKIQARARTLLHEVACLITAREINPWIRLRLSPEESPVPVSAHPSRVGVFPLSANPIHWGQLLTGLSLMARAKLDKIVYVIANEFSPSVELYPEELRRRAAEEAISLFQPLFTLVPASAGKAIGGPASLFRLLGLNNQHVMELFYVWAYESGVSTSVMEIMDALWGGGNTHSSGRENQCPVSLIRVDAGRPDSPVSLNQRILAIPQPLPRISTAAVRAALLSPLHRDELSALPACAFRQLRVLSSFD